MMKNTHSGFTMIELIITIAVASILVAMAIPSFSTFIQNNRLSSAGNSIMANIQFARSEAIRSNSAVNIARKSGTTSDLSEGWTIYTDEGSTTGNSAFSSGDGDTLLRDFSGYAGSNLTVNVDASGNQWIAFRSNGMLSEGAGVSVIIAICDDRGASSGRQITISPTGRSSLIVGSSATPLATCAP